MSFYLVNYFLFQSEKYLTETSSHGTEFLQLSLSFVYFLEEADHNSFIIFVFCHFFRLQAEEAKANIFKHFITPIIWCIVIGSQHSWAPSTCLACISHYITAKPSYFSLQFKISISPSSFMMQRLQCREYIV